MKILVTGAAGFIGMFVAERLLARGDSVIGIDNLNDYYDVSLKQSRLDRLLTQTNFEFIKVDIADRDSMKAVFKKQHFDVVIHLAAQAGVRHSIDHPELYIDSNLTGFANILEGCRQTKVAHLVYASS
ncbi:MAG: SDR family NAD(P)-dependent oxidoreductase, partial [Gammaproteobacteria bacterium]|nr:SDR family NAD(P)-dependent oxidoreductase [Gammaproteobacteria bacterium]